MNYIDEIKEARYQVLSILRNIENVTTGAKYHSDNALSYIDTALEEMRLHGDVDVLIKQLNDEIDDLRYEIQNVEYKDYERERELDILNDDIGYLEEKNSRLEYQCISLAEENVAMSELIGELFNEYLDRIEVSDSGKAFLPIGISSCRALTIEPMGELIDKIRKTFPTINLKSNQALKEAMEDAQGWT